tara:strand:+ start:5399 stop:9262 length:3864 start_codon:yes stop_codon:yes gene_type:complete
MSKELDDVFDKISKWAIDDIRKVMFHEKWTKEDREPFNKLTKSKIPPPKPPKSFNDCREKLKPLLEQELDGFNSEEKAKLIICSTFLLMNDAQTVRHDYLGRLLEDGQVQTNLFRLLNEMDNETPGGDIRKLQLFYALREQRANPSKIKIQKVTWSNVTSSWGPKVVMSDGETYSYIFNNSDGFEERFDNYKTAAKIGQTPQYRSDYNLINDDELDLKIINVIATQGCLTLAEHFESEKLGHKGSGESSKLFDKLSQEYFRNDLDTHLSAPSESLRSILPRLTEENNLDNCVESILNNKKQWLIPRTIIKYDNQSWFFIHGDEWGGNFLVAENADRVYVIDFEDAIFSNANEPDKIIRVGGDLSSRIYSPGKDEDKEFAPIGLSLFASIGRLLAAIVQYHSRWFELRTDMIGIILDEYLSSFEKSLSSKNNKGSAICEDYWNSDLKPLILLHAWDWSLYWEQKLDSRFPQKHYEKFIEEIKKLLDCDEIAVDPKLENFPRFADSQYNLFSEQNRFTPSPRLNIFPNIIDNKNIVDKSFQIQMEQFRSITDFELRTDYCLHEMLPICDDNIELEFFLILYIVYHRDYDEVKNYYQKLEQLAVEMENGSHDDLYTIITNLTIFHGAWQYSSAEALCDKLFDRLLHIPEKHTKQFIRSRLDMCRYKIWKGDYSAALYLNNDVEKRLLNDKKSFSPDEWDVKITQALIFTETNKVTRAQDLLKELIQMLDTYSELDSNKMINYVSELFNVLGGVEDSKGQKDLVNIFNNEEIKDNLDLESRSFIAKLTGTILIHEQKYNQAVKQLEIAVHSAPNSLMKSQALCMLGQANYLLKDFQTALNHYLEALKIDENDRDNWEVHNYVSICYQELGEYKQAISHLKKSGNASFELYRKSELTKYFIQYLVCAYKVLFVQEKLKQLNEIEVDVKLQNLVDKGVKKLKDISFDDSEFSRLESILEKICKSGSSKGNDYYLSILRRIKRISKEKQKASNQKTNQLDAEIEFKAIIDKAKKHRKKGSWSKAINLLEPVIEETKKLGLYSICAKAYNQLGTCYFDQRKYPKANDNYEHAMDLYCQINDEQGQIDALLNLALIADARKRHIDSDAKFDKCLEIYQKLDDKIGIADVYTNRTDIELVRGNYTKAREYVSIALAIFDDLKDNLGRNLNIKEKEKWSTALNNSANLYRYSKQFESGISELLSALLICDSASDQKGASDLYNNLGIIHMELGQELYKEGESKASKIHITESQNYFRRHLRCVSEMEEAPSDWFLKNGFFEDSKHWVEFPPDTSPDWL